MQAVSRSTVLKGANGLHARPASDLVRIAQQFQSEISLQAGGRQVSARSLLGLLSLGLKQGADVLVMAVGPDAFEAAQAAAALLEREE